MPATAVARHNDATVVALRSNLRASASDKGFIDRPQQYLGKNEAYSC